MIRTAELDLDFSKKKMEFYAGQDTYQTELDIAEEVDIKNLKDVEFKGKK